MNASARKTDAVIFDFDDTLVYTNCVFDSARLELFDLMRTEGISGETEWPEYLNSADIANIIKCGFLADRCFPLALRETYEHFSRLSGVEINSELSNEIMRIGWRVFTQPPVVREGARELLERLQGKVRLFLLTQGEQRSQYARLRLSGLLPYFQAHRIVRLKIPEAYESFIDEHMIDRSCSWMVGNSIRSDVNPALAVGLNAVLFTASSWTFDHVEPEGEPRRIDNLLDILELIEL